MQKRAIQIAVVVSFFILALMFNPSISVSSSAITGACPSDGGATNSQCFLEGPGNWELTTTSTENAAFAAVWTINKTFSTQPSGSGSTLPGCSTAAKDYESFDAQLNWWAGPAVTYPWTQEILAANTIHGGNSCLTVEYWLNDLATSPNCTASMIGGSTYDPNFNTTHSGTYNKIYPSLKATSDTMSAFTFGTTSPGDTWVLSPGGSTNNGCGGTSGGGYGLPTTMSGWNSDGTSEFNFVFVGYSSTSTSVEGFTLFKATGAGNEESNPGVAMQVWYDEAVTTIPTHIDAQAAEQSNIIYSNMFSGQKSPDGTTSVLSQDLNCVYAESTPAQLVYCD